LTCDLQYLYCKAIIIIIIIITIIIIMSVGHFTYSGWHKIPSYDETPREDFTPTFIQTVLRK